MHGRVVGRVCPRNLAGTSERGKCRRRARDALRSRILLCDRRFAIACELRASYIRASCSLFARELDRDSRGAGRDRQVRRGYCVGSPRNELQMLSTTASAQCIAVCFTPAAVAMSTVRSPAANVSARERFTTFDTSVARARRAATALLRMTTRRHAHDEHGGRRSMRAPTPWADVGIAVKNLRIMGLAVLLLNFREVRRFHFCSTSVAV
jgi:hypothetical protein